MAQMIEYECPCCGGSIEFDSAIQKMKCPYCETEFDVEAMKAFEEENKKEKLDDMNWQSQAGDVWEEGEQENMVIYACQSCGGEIISDGNLGATKCPYCGNNVVMKETFSGDLKPDYIIPFKLNKKQAKEKLREHFQGKKLLPKLFAEENHLDEVKGVYVPFWIFDASAEGEIHYKATKVRTWSDSNYNYTETRFYDITRAGSVKFQRIPVDGSSKMPDDLMESIEPYDFSEAVPFKPAYLAGYMADRYDVTAEESQGRANERIRNSTQDALEETITGFYATKVPMGSSVRLKESSAKYALYPVWLLTTSWNGETYLFAMNGQTGKFVGNLPIDKKAYWKYHFLWTFGLGVAAFALFMLFALL